MLPKIIDRNDNKVYTVYALRPKNSQTAEALIYNEYKGWVWVVLDERYMPYERSIHLSKYY